MQRKKVVGGSFMSITKSGDRLEQNKWRFRCWPCNITISTVSQGKAVEEFNRHITSDIHKRSLSRYGI